MFASNVLVQPHLTWMENMKQNAQLLNAENAVLDIPTYQYQELVVAIVFQSPATMKELNIP